MSSPPTGLQGPLAPAPPFATKKRLSSASIASSQSYKRARLHPLRQTSFPSLDGRDAAATATATATATGSSGHADGHDNASAAGSLTGSLTGSQFGKRRSKSSKRDRDRERDRNAEADGTASVKGRTPSLVNGEARRGSDRALGSIAEGGGGGGEGAGDGEDEEDLEEEGDGDGDGDGAATGDGLMARDEAAASDSEAEKQNLAILVDAFDPEQSARYDLFKRAKLNKAMLRKIVNQTLSQSVPPNVITTIGGYTKVFIGELVERARTVQEQWAEIEDRHAREEILRQRQAERRQRRRRQQRGEKDREPEETDADVKMAADDSSSPAGAATRAESPSQPPPPDAANSDAAMPDPSPPQTHDDAADGDRPTTAASSEHGPHDTHAAPASDTEMASTSEAEAEAEAPPQDTPVADHELPPNPHRGQLLPQHLREALRQYKRDHEGGGVGFAGLSLRSLGVQGSGAWGQNGGGKRLFR